MVPASLTKRVQHRFVGFTCVDFPPFLCRHYGSCRIVLGLGPTMSSGAEVKKVREDFHQLLQNARGTSSTGISFVALLRVC